MAFDRCSIKDYLLTYLLTYLDQSIPWSRDRGIDRWTGQYPILAYTTWRDLNQSQPHISIRGTAICYRDLVEWIGQDALQRFHLQPTEHDDTQTDVEQTLIAASRQSSQVNRT